MYKLLIVDDEPLIRRGIKSLADLAGMGISQIIEAENGQEAIEMVAVHRPHLVLMDINMPEMDGLTAAAMIKEKNPQIFVIILTGYDYFEYAQSAIRAKVDDYILKPVSKADIEMVLVKSLARIKEKNKEAAIHEVLANTGMLMAGNKSDGDDIAGAIGDYLRENMFSKDLSLGKMAEDIGFNSSYLSTMVKQIYGIPFQEYINKKRMEKAKILLLSTNMKNYEIADQVGIEDVNYFSTKFKKTWGISPKQYRQGQEKE